MLSIFRNNSLILASASPRRRELLEKVGLSIEVIPAQIDETMDISQPIETELQRLAREKVAVVARQRSGLILGADTIVVLDNEVLNKPSSRETAYVMLSRLSGRTHQVKTGYHLLQTMSETVFEQVVTTFVTFFKLSHEDIEWYLDQSESLDKAGAYAIQEQGTVLVKSVNGSVNNVIGLPVEQVIRDIGQLRPGR